MSRPKPSSRANGRLSKGPITPQGKARSSKNALRHGFRARETPFPPETRLELDRLTTEFHHSLHPRDRVESALVDAIAHARCRMSQLWSLETSLINRALAAPSAANTLDPLAAAYDTLCNDPHFRALCRQETHFSATFHRYLRRLFELRQQPHEQLQHASLTPEIPPRAPLHIERLSLIASDISASTPPMASTISLPTPSAPPAPPQTQAARGEK